jgi:hypothetical protein
MTVSSIYNQINRRDIDKQTIFGQSSRLAIPRPDKKM